MSPWEEVRSGFLNGAGLKMWLCQITGDEVAFSELQDARGWLQGAKEGDIGYMNCDWKMVPQEEGEIEIRCNWV
jgi:hypothetical protein